MDRKHARGEPLRFVRDLAFDAMGDSGGVIMRNPSREQMRDAKSGEREAFVGYVMRAIVC
eukprot:UN19373